jgi:hypothetical protein
MDPSLEAPHYMLFELYRKSGDLEKAREEFNVFSKLKKEREREEQEKIKDKDRVIKKIFE